MESYSLFEVNEYIKRVLALNFAEALWIRCEIGQLNESGGHVFMDLVQKAEDSDEIIARCEAVIWKRSLRQLIKKHKLSLDKVLMEGNEIMFKAEIDFHERYGMKLNILDLDADFTIGKILVKRSEVIQRLQKEGILKKNASLDLGKVIQRVAVISSANAAGLQDYLKQIKDNPYQYQINNSLFIANVQGDRAASDIAKQLKKIKQFDFDCVIIIRGGGARLDLSAFDEYELGKEIANCPIPVITGIGHDVDETVADQVAHTDVKTPTAVADFIIHHNAYFESSIQQIGLDIKESAGLILRKAALDLQSQQQSIALSASRKRQNALNELLIREEHLKNSIRTFFLRKNADLEQKEMLLEAVDMQNTLARGYAIVTKDGNKIVSIEQLKAQDDLNIILKDGQFETIVKKISK